MRGTKLGMLVGAMAGAGLWMTPAAAMPGIAGATATAKVAAPVSALAVEQAEYYYAPRPYYGPRAYYGPRRYYAPGGYAYGRRGWRGDGVAAGVAAGALGALAIGGLAASGAFDPPAPAYAPIAPARRQWCADRFRSYNPADGTYIGRDGRVRYCG